MPALKFKIAPTAYINLQTNPKLFLEDVLFHQDDKSIYNDVIEALLAFHKDDGGSPVTREFNVAECSYDEHSKTGRVKLTYQVSYTFGCADIHRSDDNTETCKFSIDTQNNQLTLHITDHISRDTVDEF